MTSQELNAALAEFDLQADSTPYEELWAKWDELNLDGLPEVGLCYCQGHHLKAG